jgi:chromosome segregation ATPase
VKATSRVLGSEAYTVALAGAGALPELPPVAALTGTMEPRRWIEHFDEQQELLTKQADYLARLEGLDAERRELRGQLVSAETELAELRERVFGLEREAYRESERAGDALAETEHVRAELEQVRAELARAEGVMASVWRSASWRSTRPLRSVKARATRTRRD